jgi:hypothetical protein
MPALSCASPKTGNNKIDNKVSTWVVIAFCFIVTELKLIIFSIFHSISGKRGVTITTGQKKFLFITYAGTHADAYTKSRRLPQPLGCSFIHNLVMRSPQTKLPIFYQP